MALWPHGPLSRRRHDLGECAHHEDCHESVLDQMEDQGASLPQPAPAASFSQELPVVRGWSNFTEEQQGRRVGEFYEFFTSKVGQNPTS